MAIRKTTHILKNSDVTGRPLPTNLHGGEAIVNTADGIVYFSGVTASANNWTPSGAGSAANFFEVGSNLYDLKIRNKITAYGGSSGASLVGKFLSGTTNGFVLADISSIAGVDTFVTGFSYSNNVATITRNQGLPSLSITINSMTGLTVTGTLTATTANIGTNNVTTLNATGGTITTLNSTTLNLGKIATYAGSANVSGKFLSGTTTGFVLADISSIIGVDTFVTSASYAPTTNTITLNRNNGQSAIPIYINSMSGLTVTGILTATTANIGTGNVGTLTATTGTITTLNSTTLNLGKIATYAGSANVSGKFLSGTTTGFVLADINSIGGLDTLVTGFTYSNNVFTIKQNLGQPDLNAVINSMTGLTISGTLAATTANIGTNNVTTLNATGGTITTLGSTTATITTGNFGTLTAATGTVTTLGSTTANITNGFVNNLTATAGTVNTLDVTALNLGKIAKYDGVANVAGKFLSGTTSGFVLADIATTIGYDTIVNGFSYAPTTNTITLTQNGQTARTVQINSMSGLTLSSLTPDRLVYTSTGGKLVTGTAIFDGTDMTLPNNGKLSVGTGGLVVGSGGSPGVGGTGDLVVNGSLTVYGPSVSAFTSELYIEDDNITLNFNPTGDTSSSSVGAGWTIQDGSGVAGSAVNFDVRPMNNFAGIVVGQTPNISEYTSTIGYANRAWVTQLNDIVIRSTDEVTPKGVRVLAEFDILDGGVY